MTVHFTSALKCLIISLNHLVLSMHVCMIKAGFTHAYLDMSIASRVESVLICNAIWFLPMLCLFPTSHLSDVLHIIPSYAACFALVHQASSKAITDVYCFFVLSRGFNQSNITCLSCRLQIPARILFPE